MIRQLEPAELERLRPLWEALHSHHASIAEGIAPVRDVADSWARRRTQYAHWLAEGDCAIFVDELDGALVGYAAVRIENGPSTWDVGACVAELETLSVLPDARGGGVGRELTRAAEAWARSRGAESFFVGVAHTNADALRFYARVGFGPYYELLWKTLT